VAGWPARHDNCAAIRDVTARVLTRGHTSVAYLGYIPQGEWDVERESGCQDAMTAAGLPVTVIRTGTAPAEVDATVADLLGPPDRPTAVIAGSDVLAAACYAGDTRTGLRIGVDLAVTGFDGRTVAARILTPALTTVAMPLAEVAERLVDRIVSAVSGVSDERGEVLETALIWGESVWRGRGDGGAAQAAQGAAAGMPGRLGGPGSARVVAP